MTQRIETVLECTDLAANVDFFVGALGVRVERITPADSPATIVLVGPDTVLRLERSDRDVAGRLVMHIADEADVRVLAAPNGTTIDFVVESDALVLPANVPRLSINRAQEEFGTGRAGMEYRDMLPDRWGGRFIASHIRIPAGGPVADSVHFHRVRFQMIFCARGWVDLVYEDQGPPFRLHEGDCVLQPPEIRHRVLAASPGLEVLEIGCPAIHDTFIEHEIELPTATFDPYRVFDGQCFVRDVAAGAKWEPWLVDGLRARQTAIAQATAGLAGVTVVSCDDCANDGDGTMLGHDAEFVFDVVLRGAADVHLDDATTSRTERVGAFDAVAIPPGTRWTWTDWSADFEFVEITLPPNAVAARR